MMKYQILDQLQQHKAQLLDSVELGSGHAGWPCGKTTKTVSVFVVTTIRLVCTFRVDITVIKDSSKVGIMAVGQIICAWCLQDFESTWDLRDHWLCCASVLYWTTFTTCRRTGVGSWTKPNYYFKSTVSWPTPQIADDLSTFFTQWAANRENLCRWYCHNASAQPFN